MNYGLKTFPSSRMRRLRMKSFLRNLVSENSISANDLIWPVFLVEGNNEHQKIKSMPNVYRFSIDRLVKELEQLVEYGLQAIALFPQVDSALKDEGGTNAYDPNNLICRAIQTIKTYYPELGVIADIALDPYTTHGHDGIMIEDEIVNDKTLSVLKQQALVFSEAGCDILAPSDMMDGRVGIIRQALDENRMKNTVIMSYAAKYASSFYGPFRDAVKSEQLTGVNDKMTYQMNYMNGDEAMHEIALDIGEGADMIIIKPGMPYLDIILRAKQEFKVPTFAYQVSGEYSMILSASNRIDNLDIILESIISFKRAGADGIITYFTPSLLEYLK
ncbi:MAG: porphobilinogen synthase [Candidatus Marinimicrobia bacterium]|nr:porphobilinogen synthase [Candidatus Neomarinimicrobiota bacterium]